MHLALSLRLVCVFFVTSRAEWKFEDPIARNFLLIKWEIGVRKTPVGKAHSLGKQHLRGGMWERKRNNSDPSEDSKAQMPGRPEKPMELIKPPRMSAVWFSTGPEVEGGSASRESTKCNININSNISNKSNKDEKSLASWLHEEISLDCQLGKNLFIFGSNELTERQADKQRTNRTDGRTFLRTDGQLWAIPHKTRRWVNNQAATTRAAAQVANGKCKCNSSNGLLYFPEDGLVITRSKPDLNGASKTKLKDRFWHRNIRKKWKGNKEMWKIKHSNTVFINRKLFIL